MALSNSYPTRIKGWIDILDLESRAVIFSKVPLSHMTMRFALQSVPSASFILNVGQDAVTRQLADIHNRPGELSNKVRVQAFLDFSGQESPDRAWPEAAFRAFDGVSTGVGYQTSRGDSAFVLNAAHWLEELDAGAVASAALTKNSGDNYLSVVGFSTDDATGLASIDLVSTFGTPGNSDLWNDMLKPMIKGVMGYKPKGVGGDVFANPRFQNLIQQLKSACSPIPGPEIKAGNDRAVQILNEKFNNPALITPAKLTVSHLVERNAAGDVRGQIRKDLAEIVSANIGNATALEKILTAASQFTCVLTANVEGAVLAPITPALRSSVIWRTITASEYSFVDGQAFTPRVLAGVVLLGSEVTSTDVPVNDSTNEPRPAGAFRAYPRGQTMFARAPGWLLLPFPKTITQQTVEKARTVGPRNAGDSDSLGKLIRKSVDKNDSVGCAFAQAIWCNEVFRHRTTGIRGRLRFDIAPGSTVALRGVGEKVPGMGSDVLYGVVSGVEVHVDAATPSGHTYLTLSHLRTDKEQDRLPTKHPIFSEVWAGAPLVKLAASDMKAERVG